MKLNLFIYLSIIIILSSCGSSKKLSKHEEQMLTAPEWVKARPINNLYYIGISKVSKITYPSNYREAAKRVALNDLASEISVTIESNSLVSTFEDNAGYKSEFSRYIKMEMQKDLSGYQLVSSFETEEMYMVYYRLSKSKWAEIQAKKKQAAVGRSYTAYQQSINDKAELNYISSINASITALLELKKYWNEPTYYQNEGENRRLDIDIRESIVNTLSEIELKYEPTKLVLDATNKYSGKLNISVVNANGDKLSGFPIRVNYRKTSLPFQTIIYSKKTNVVTDINSVKYKTNNLFLYLQFEKERIIRIKNEDKKLLKFMTDAFQNNSIKIPINYVLPNIYISSNKEKSQYYHHIKDALQQSLGKQNFSVVNSKKNAELYFKINIHETNSKSSTKIKSSYLTYSIEVKNKAGVTEYTYSSDSYKGVDYTLEGAKDKSYQNAAEDIDGGSFKSMLQAIIK